ncbi:MAG: DnaB-like helicase C-terminal domain-containing protein, partial [Chloroflexota bacterium]|nr:DnaB-like helicase C-terminal domain-containing protein [Chloroflexota bacterium]
LAASQLSRAVEMRPNRRPQLSDLRESGSIEQDADVVTFIHREDKVYTQEEWDQRFQDRPYPKNIAELIIAKHRHGPVGSVHLYFREDYVRFEDLPAQEEAVR